MAPRTHKTRSKSITQSARKAAKASRSVDQKVIDRNVMKSLVACVLEKEEEVKALGKERLPKEYYKKLITPFIQIIPTLSEKSLKNAVCYQKRKNLLQTVTRPTTANTQLIVTSHSHSSTEQTLLNDDNLSSNSKSKNKKGGRPNKEKHRIANITNCMAVNEITHMAMEVKDREGALTHTSFEKIVNEVRVKRNLPESFEIKRSTVKKRIQRNKLVVDAHLNHGGVDTPLAEVEPVFVEMVLCMSKLRQSLTSTEIMHLVNSSIEGTEYQRKLIEFKKIHKIEQMEDKLGKVGRNYMAGFMKRWGHLLSSTKAQKFELDRSRWTQYSNFKHMYDCIEDTLISCGLAEKLAEPVWMDQEGNIVEKQEDALGQKCTIRITHPEFCLVGDEVGSNTSQQGDGHVGGRRYIGPRGYVPQQKASKKDRKFTVIGLTNLKGEPVMCVVIIEGIARQLEVELGVDYSAHWEGSVEDADFIKKNTGPGKRFPGGPKCRFQGKEVPCFVRFHQSGGITGEILLDIFKTMEHYELFQRARQEGKTPFVLIDGHGSRFHLPFVQYINHPTTKYCVSIGVPYGTSFWQVGDSKEQNGCFKIATYRVKEEIMQERESLMMDTVGILPSDIMIIVKRSWDKSFARVEQNRKAIAERGWYPYNRNLLKNEEIRITMTEKESQEDMFLNMDRISSASSSSPCSSISELTDPSFDSFCTQGSSLVNRHGIKPTTLNLSSGMGMHVLKSIVRESDLAKAREEIEQQKKDGVRKKTLLKDMKKITAGNMVRCGEFVIGKPIEEWIYEKEMERRKLDEEKQERMKARLEARALKEKESLMKKEMREKQRQENEKKKKVAEEDKRKRQQEKSMARYDRALRIIQTKEKHTWKIKDYKTVLMCVKKKSDGRLPSTLHELSECYENWKDRNNGMIALGQTRADCNVVGNEIGEEAQESTDSNLHAEILSQD